MKRKTCVACRKQYGVNRILSVTLGLGIGPQLPPVKMRTYDICAACIPRLTPHIIDGISTMLSPWRKEPA